MKQVRILFSGRDTEPHPEKRSHEKNIAQVSEDPHLVRHPTNQGQLEGENREGCQEELQAKRSVLYQQLRLSVVIVQPSAKTRGNVRAPARIWGASHALILSPAQLDAFAIRGLEVARNHPGAVRLLCPGSGHQGHRPGTA